MDDHKYVKEISGAAGGLAKISQDCNSMNSALTKFFDLILGGADNTDTFDASCNTCKHFERENFDRNINPVSIYGFPGYCKKLQKKTTGWPRGQYDAFKNYHCYENRRTGLTPAKLKVILSK